MSIKDRLQIVIKMNNLTNASFADKIEVQRSSISHIMAGRNKPSLDFIQKTLLSFPKVDAQWLITGKQSQTNSLDHNGQEDELHSISTSGKDIIDDKEATPKAKPTSRIQSNKSIKRVVVYFDDGTYVETKT
jgi:transcriptional regulator with XRE-family HTH domain